MPWRDVTAMGEAMSCSAELPACCAHSTALGILCCCCSLCSWSLCGTLQEDPTQGTGDAGIVSAPPRCRRNAAASRSLRAAGVCLQPGGVCRRFWAVVKGYLQAAGLYLLTASCSFPFRAEIHSAHSVWALRRLLLMYQEQGQPAWCHWEHKRNIELSAACLFGCSSS